MHGGIYILLVVLQTFFPIVKPTYNGVDRNANKFLLQPRENGQLRKSLHLLGNQYAISRKVSVINTSEPLIQSFRFLKPHIPRRFDIKVTASELVHAELFERGGGGT